MFYVSLVLCLKKYKIQAWSETGKLFSCNILCTWQREDLPTPVSPSITILTQCIGASSSSGLGSGSYTPPRVKVPRSCNRYHQTFFFFSTTISIFNASSCILSQTCWMFDSKEDALCWDGVVTKTHYSCVSPEYPWQGPQSCEEVCQCLSVSS